MFDVVFSTIDNPAEVLSDISTIHTLGPKGTNCEAAAEFWFDRHDRDGTTVLHATLEEAAEAMLADRNAALLGCVVYPDLHTLVFANLSRFCMTDIFVMPTHPMVLASRGSLYPKSVSTHPAPQHLVPRSASKQLVTSNSQAALNCAAGLTEGCITTAVAARECGLRIVTNFGPVPMGFTIHTPYRNAPHGSAAMAAGSDAGHRKA